MKHTGYIDMVGEQINEADLVTFHTPLYGSSALTGVVLSVDGSWVVEASTGRRYCLYDVSDTVTKIVEEQ